MLRLRQVRPSLSGEVQYRFNRRFDLSVILARLLRAAAVTAPNPSPSFAWLRYVANQESG